MKRTKEDLSPQERLFCEFYCEIGGECYCNGTAAAKAAVYGQKSAHNTASRLLKYPAIREYCQELWLSNVDKYNISPHKVLNDTLDLQRRAKNKKPPNLRVEMGCIELVGKYLSMWVEKYNVGMEEQRVLTPEEAKKAKLWAKIEMEYEPEVIINLLSGKLAGDENIRRIG